MSGIDRPKALIAVSVKSMCLDSNQDLSYDGSRDGNQWRSYHRQYLRWTGYDGILDMGHLYVVQLGIQAYVQIIERALEWTLLYLVDAP